MPKMRTYECPGTRKHAPHQFTFLHHPNDEPPPRFCPVCGCDSQAEGFDDAVTAPHIQRPIRAVVDNNYRAMEAGAEHRAERARELFGADAAEASNLKFTDMRDNARPGENSAVEVVNAVTHNMAAINAAHPGVVGFQPGASSLSPEVQTGPYPNAGAHAMQGVRAAHARHIQQNEGGRGAISDAPALETQAVGYRRRA